MAGSPRNANRFKAERDLKITLENSLVWDPNGKEVGRWGLVQPRVAEACGVHAPVYWADFDVAQLWKAVRKRKIKAKELPKFPSVRRDLALVVDKSIPYESLRLAAQKAERKLLQEVSLFDVYEGKGMEEGEKS